MTLPAEDDDLWDKDSRKILFSYEAPLKGQGKQRLCMLDYYPSLERQAPAIGNSLRDSLVAQFKAHKKQVGVEVYRKINNTLEFLEKCKQR